MNYHGYWRYDNSEALICGETKIEKEDIVYILAKKDGVLYGYHKKISITIRENDLIRFFIRELRRGHPPAKCGKGPICCELCHIWVQKKQC